MSNIQQLLAATADQKISSPMTGKWQDIAISSYEGDIKSLTYFLPDTYKRVSGRKYFIG